MAPANVPVVTGYYRYTDIWFEWHKALPNAEDRAPVKAIFAHDALVHPDHPLHVEGVVGIQMYLGSFASGEARLLFSSKQVDYIRYWLHAMGVTKSIVPLPYSDCLLTTATLKTISPVVYKTGFALKNAIKDIDKNNKRLKKGNRDPAITNRRQIFERVRAFWAARKGVWCAVDFESWERDHTLLLEFGYSLVAWNADGSRTEETGHLIVKENMYYQNSTFVKGNRDSYDFGQSEVLKKVELQTRIHQLFERLRSYGPVFLTFHDNNHDIKDLQNLGVNLDGLTYLLDDSIPETGIIVIDTADLIGGLLGEGAGSNKGLQQTCNLLQIPTKHLHNAGNDAHYTLLAMQAMANGEPLDTQREQRWPKQTPSTGVTVDLEAWQEDGDCSDQEGMFAPVINPKSSEL